MDPKNLSKKNNTDQHLPKTEKETSVKPKQPVKEKKKFPWITILLLCFTLLVMVIAVVMGYLYFTNRETYSNLLSEKNSLEDQIEQLQQEKNAITEENATLEEEKTSLEEENASLESEITGYEAIQAQIKAYNDFDEYVFYVVGIHGGFINLTEDEYQTARSKAEATGDEDLVAAVDSAWNDTHISPIIRFVNVMNAVIEGIDENCQ